LDNLPESDSETEPQNPEEEKKDTSKHQKAMVQQHALNLASMIP